MFLVTEWNRGGPLPCHGVGALGDAGKRRGQKRGRFHVGKHDAAAAAGNGNAQALAGVVAAQGQVLGRGELLALCPGPSKTVLLPSQMAPNGSFPLKTKRTNSYGSVSPTQYRVFPGFGSLGHHKLGS